MKIKTMERNINNCCDILNDSTSELNEISASMTSTLPTIKKINDVLYKTGFNNFYIKESNKNKYIIVRHNNESARETLSEGEKSFISFLYFYFLVRSENVNKPENKIVIIDDPVSSMDSSVLFIVSSLIEDIKSCAKNENDTIKQIIILTHNTFFYKNITSNEKYKKNTPKFWIVRKNENFTNIKSYIENPIKTSYELAWQDIKYIKSSPNISQSSIFTIQNTIRRILEYYFTFLGKENINSLPERFNGAERKICQSFIQWNHSGSHNICDDINVTLNENDVFLYLKIFKEIFFKTNHGEHYKMMMNTAD